MGSGTIGTDGKEIETVGTADVSVGISVSVGADVNVGPIVSVGGTGEAVTVSVAGGSNVAVAIGGKGVSVDNWVWVGGIGVGSNASVLQLARIRLKTITMIRILNRKLDNSIGVLHEKKQSAGSSGISAIGPRSVVSPQEFPETQSAQA
jgi:hypothetical protein